jgi:hypothetical protein
MPVSHEQRLRDERAAALDAQTDDPERAEEDREAAGGVVLPVDPALIKDKD